MNNLPLDKLFIKKTKLHEIKYDYIYKIFHTHINFLKRYLYVLKLKELINKEIFLHKKIYKKIQKTYKKNKSIFFIDSLKDLNKKVIKTLKKEYKYLNNISFLLVLKNNFKFFFSKKATNPYLYKHSIEFKKIFQKELEINEKLTTNLYKQNIKLYNIKRFKKQKLLQEKQLLKQTQQLLKEFIKSIGNKKLVQKRGKKLLNVLTKLKTTEVYGFVKQDVIAIQKKVQYVMEHPKESKLTYLFTTIYLIAPGTFPLTGAILTLRYMTKYSFNRL